MADFQLPKKSPKNFDSFTIFSSNEALLLYELSVPYMITLETCHEDNVKLIVYQIFPGGNHLISPDKSQLSRRPHHQHAFVEIMFVLSGTVTHHIEQQSFTYLPGQCCIMNKNIQHHEEFSGDYQAVFFSFQNEFLSDLVDEYSSLKVPVQHRPSNPIYQLLNKNQNNTFQYDKMYLDCFPRIGIEDIMNEMKPYFNLIVTETISEDPGSHFLVKGAFARFFHKLNSPALYSVESMESTVHGQQYLFQKISHIMEASIGRAKREDLVTQLHYNGEYLNRIVKKYTGRTINEYGQYLYLEEARRLLIDTNMSISSIITKIGFSNRTHFYRLFEKTYGQTPQSYRSSHLK